MNFLRQIERNQIIIMLNFSSFEQTYRCPVSLIRFSTFWCNRASYECLVQWCYCPPLPKQSRRLKKNDTTIVSLRVFKLLNFAPTFARRRVSTLHVSAWRPKGQTCHSRNWTAIAKKLSLLIRDKWMSITERVMEAHQHTFLHIYDSSGFWSPEGTLHLIGMLRGKQEDKKFA